MMEAREALAAEFHLTAEDRTALRQWIRKRCSHFYLVEAALPVSAKALQ